MAREDLKPVDISYVNKRCRQESVYDLLNDMRHMADTGELVGCVIMYVDNEGQIHHKRDMFAADTPALLGYLSLLQQNLGRQYLDGCEGDCPHHDDDAG